MHLFFSFSNSQHVNVKMGWLEIKQRVGGGRGCLSCQVGGDGLNQWHLTKFYLGALSSKVPFFFFRFHKWEKRGGKEEKTDLDS